MNIATIQAVSLILLIMVPVMIMQMSHGLADYNDFNKGSLILLKKVKRKSSGKQFALMEEILVNFEIVREESNFWVKELRLDSKSHSKCFK